jgi:glucose/arabinose dehydrogenase
MTKLIFILSAVTVWYTSFAQNTATKSVELPEHPTKSFVKFSKVKGWDHGQTPIAPAGFKVTPYAAGLQNPRWTYALPNGDLLVAESNNNFSFLEKIGALIVGASHSHNMHKSADRITLLRDENRDGKVDVRTEFKTKLHQPLGMLLLGQNLYIASTDALWRFPYETGETQNTTVGEKLVDLPGGMRHWTKNIIESKDGKKIYIAVGSGSNIGEKGMDKEKMRADILEINPDGSDLKIYAAGLRNPVGMGWSTDGKLWAVVNERDELGDDLVPDYLTHVEPGGFYGWPYMYWGTHPDPRVKDPRPEQASRSLIPDVALGAHTASLGLAFYDRDAFPDKYRYGVFIGQHGSWNRSELSGYKVIFIPFRDGKPSGPAEDFLTGFVSDLGKRKVHGRPVGVTVMPDGSLMVADDVSGILWKVSAVK